MPAPTIAPASRRRETRLHLTAALLWLFFLLGCGIPNPRRACQTADGCAFGMDCVDGVCVAPLGAASGGAEQGDAGSLPGEHASTAKLGCTTCGGDHCVDLARDAKHCGGCDIACVGGTTCESGHCVCPDGETLCFERCQPLMSDFYNCGGCGNVCAATQTCVEGICRWPPEACSNAYDDDQTGSCDDNCGTHSIHVEVKHGFSHYGNHANAHYWVYSAADIDGFSSGMWEERGVAFRTASQTVAVNGVPALRELLQCRDANGRLVLSLDDCGVDAQLSSLGYIKGDINETCSEWIPLRALYEDTSLGRARYYTVRNDTAERYIEGGMQPLETDRQWQVLAP